MTREESIEIFKRLKENAPNEMHLETVGTAQELFDMAIQALSQEPTFDDECQKDMDEAWEQIQKKRKRIPVTLDLTPCDDAISRDDRLLDLANAIESDDSGYWTNKRISSALRNIKNLPSVTQKSGEWIVHEKPHGIRYLECPYCNTWYLNEHLIRNSYCPNCGAKMQESEDKTE